MFTNSFKEAHYTNLYLDFIKPNETTSSRLDIQDKKIDSQDTKLEDLASRMDQQGTKIGTIVENTIGLKMELNKRVLELGVEFHKLFRDSESRFEKAKHSLVGCFVFQLL